MAPVSRAGEGPEERHATSTQPASSGQPDTQPSAGGLGERGGGSPGRAVVPEMQTRKLNSSVSVQQQCRDESYRNGEDGPR